MFKTNRKSVYPVHELLLNRWSPRSFDRNKRITKAELMTLFDAARWAQNSYNNQPWRFLYSFSDSKDWNLFLDLLVEANKIWAQYASVLVAVVAKKTFDYDGRPSITHAFDTGAASQNMALQAAWMDIVCHGMEGFDYKKAAKDLEIPDEYAVQAMFAIGKKGAIENLPEKLQEREKPSDRKLLDEIVMEGKFKAQ